MCVLHACFAYVWTGTFLGGCMCMCVHSCGDPGLMSEIILDHTYILIIGAQSSLIRLVQFVLRIHHLYLMRLELQTGYHGILAFTKSFGPLNSSFFRNKWSNYQSLFLGPIFLNFILPGPHFKKRLFCYLPPQSVKD